MSDREDTTITLKRSTKDRLDTVTDFDSITHDELVNHLIDEYESQD
jgi:hypothetical protein